MSMCFKNETKYLLIFQIKSRRLAQVCFKEHMSLLIRYANKGVGSLLNSAFEREPGVCQLTWSKLSHEGQMGCHVDKVI